jgi:hypothetical protein
MLQVSQLFLYKLPAMMESIKLYNLEGKMQASNHNIVSLYTCPLIIQTNFGFVTPSHLGVTRGDIFVDFSNFQI